MYIVLAVMFMVRAGTEEAFTAFEGGATNVGNYLMQSFTQGLQFGVAVAVILFGVRTILGELVPAFQGIAAKVVPGAIPALDAPIVFPYAQNAVLVGFIFSFIGGLVGLALAAWLGPTFGVALILPGLVPHSSQVVQRASTPTQPVDAAAPSSVRLLTASSSPSRLAFLLGVLGSFGDANTTFGDADFGWFGLLLGWSSKVGGALGLVLIAVLGLAVLALGWFSQRKLVATNWDPTPWREQPGAAARRARHLTLSRLLLARLQLRRSIPRCFLRRVLGSAQDDCVAILVGLLDKRADFRAITMVAGNAAAPRSLIQNPGATRQTWSRVTVLREAMRQWPGRPLAWKLTRRSSKRRTAKALACLATSWKPRPPQTGRFRKRTRTASQMVIARITEPKKNTK